MMSGFKRRLMVLALAGLPLAGCEQQSEADLPVTSVAVNADCRIETGCTASAGGLSVAVQFGDTPRALQPFPVSLKTIGRETAQAVYVSFVMQGMDMGLNRYRLSGDAMSAWRGDITLPICVSGRSDWIAEFDIVLAERRVVLQVPFVLSK